MTKLPVYLIDAKTRLDLAEIFMRFQEFYESPVFKGRYFSSEEYKAWYASKHRTKYEQDWYGFNIPSWILEPFKNGNFDPLSEKESNLVRYFNNVKGNFYVIGITRQDPEWLDTLKHELAHGAFFVNENYRKDVLDCISGLRPDPAKVALEKMGYAKNVVDDETNAYLLTEPQTLGKDISLGNGKKIQKELDFIFEKHFGYSVAMADPKLLLSGINEVLI